MEPVILLDSSRGIYVPRDFVLNCDCEAWGIDPEDADVLRAGPEHDLYWDAWNDVLDTAVYEDEEGVVWTLYQDGDLFAIPEGFNLDGWELGGLPRRKAGPFLEK